jgi:hypothetical protein
MVQPVRCNPFRAVGGHYYAHLPREAGPANNISGCHDQQVPCPGGLKPSGHVFFCAIPRSISER